MPTILLTVEHPSGLHARPAAEFVKTAALFTCKITVRNLSANKNPVNAKSVLSVLTQGVNQGNQIEISADGEQSEEALNALRILIEQNFGD